MKLLPSGPEGAGNPSNPLGTRTPTASQAATPSGLPLRYAARLRPVGERIAAGTKITAQVRYMRAIPTVLLAMVPHAASSGRGGRGPVGS
jgi:hypothetical protein